MEKKIKVEMETGIIHGIMGSGFSKIEGALLEAPMMRITIFWGPQD